MGFEYVCARCRRQRLFFTRPTVAPTCRHGRRWSLFGEQMRRV